MRQFKHYLLFFFMCCFTTTLYATKQPVVTPPDKNNEYDFADVKHYISAQWQVLTRTANKTERGLLYLPFPYVVPGGMFDEMYGWDSYFILRGLLEDHQFQLAKGIIENFFYEIQHYGAILNANRDNFFSRSQPPFLTAMILEYADAVKKIGKVDQAWLARAYQFAVDDYHYWTKAPHLAGETGLSRYYDFNDGPVEELNSTTHYLDAVKYFILNPVHAIDNLAKEGDKELLGPLYTFKLCQENAPKPTCYSIQKVGLTKAFYKNDRAVRESGLDLTFRFGPFGANTVDYAPVDLNSLLYKIEMDLATISAALGKQAEANAWRIKASKRRQLINQYFWNEAEGLFYDYNVKTNTQSNYKFLATFFPLWSGLATKKQAARIYSNLKLFERNYGLLTSVYWSGAQWDAPYGWAPLQLIAIEGLRRYGYNQAADRLSLKYLSLIATNFRKEGTIREKYNVLTGTADTHIEVGYRSNEIGFGWTNGVFLTLHHQLLLSQGL